MRAVLVTTGTVAGVVAVFTYSSGEAAVVVADVPAADVAGLGAPTPRPTATPTSNASPPATAAPSSKPKPTKTRAEPSATQARTARPAPTATRTAKPPPAPAPKPTKKATPKPTPTPKPKPSGDFTGPAVTFKYGTLQIGIRVSDGRIVDAWAVSYPHGDSEPYSEMAVPILREQTIGATSADIAGATGASFTSLAWEKSLAGAIAKAGI
jgi:uncharacterized protein with FMN-binding domain